MTNHLYYGDNLYVLREHIADESVDLIYLDPPFNSQANYNVLFRSPKGEQSQAQIEAFEDTWSWNDSAERAFDEVMQSGNTDAAEMLRAMRAFLKENDMMAYLTMMAVRLLELHRVLKQTGSIYLHCDPTASHYLNLIMSAAFQIKNYQNEIIWKRTYTHADAKRFGAIHDIILFYNKETKYSVWNTQFRSHSDTYLNSHYSSTDELGRRFQLISASAPGHGKVHPPMRFGDKLISPPPGRMWSWTQEKIDKLWLEGRLIITSKGTPRFKLTSVPDKGGEE